jgi:hypothetical protein
MARKRRAPKYAGALAQPIYVDDYKQLVGGLGQWEELNIAAMSKRASEKMQLLFKHYKIDPSEEQSWKELAISLAHAHVPGLQPAFRAKPGRKPTWKAEQGDELVRAVEDVKSRTGKRTKEAIAELREQPGGMWKRHTPQNLGARYRESRRRQKALASLREAWENDVRIVLGLAAPSATAAPLGRPHEVTGRATKIRARAKTSRRK